MSEKRHWAHVQESTCVAGVWIFYWLHALIGRALLRGAMYPVVMCFWASNRIGRRASREYLARLQRTARVFASPPGWRESVRHFASFAETMLDKMLAMSGHYRLENVQIEGGDWILRQLAGGRGAVMVTAHIGCLELCSAVAQTCPGLKLNIMVHTKNAQRFNAVLRRLNPAMDLQLLQVTEIGPATATLLASKVENGEFVVIAGDRVPVTTSKTVEVEFLGQSAHFPVGPYILAAILHCPLYMMSCIHEGTTYRIEIERLAERVTLPRRGRMEAVHALAREYAARLEMLVKRSPYDWFNFFPFWDQPCRVK